jgi:hypothetical protein
MSYVTLKLNFEVLTSKIHISVRGHTNKQGKFDWTSAVLDAGIISGIILFTGLGTLASFSSQTRTRFFVVSEKIVEAPSEYSLLSASDSISILL